MQVHSVAIDLCGARSGSPQQLDNLQHFNNTL